MVLKEVVIPSATQMMVGSCIGQTIQAVIFGSNVQLVYRYFLQPRRDPPSARLGILFLTALLIAHLVLCNYQTVRVIMYHDRKVPVVLFKDWWLYNLGLLIKVCITLPVLLFCTRRAYIIWNRSKLVLALCLSLDLVSLICWLVSISEGLEAPWGLQPLTDDEYSFWCEALFAKVTKFRETGLAAICIQLANVVTISFLICYGIYRHRNGFREMDHAVSRIAFLCGESLLPVVLINIVDVVGQSITESPSAILLSRVAMQLAPPIYFYALILPLVSRQRVAAILSAEPVRYMPSLRPTVSHRPSGFSTAATAVTAPAKPPRRTRRRFGLPKRLARASREDKAASINATKTADPGAEEMAVGSQPRVVSLLYSPALEFDCPFTGERVSSDLVSATRRPSGTGPMISRGGSDDTAVEKTTAVGQGLGEKEEETDPERRPSIYDIEDILRRGPAEERASKRGRKRG